MNRILAKRPGAVDGRCVEQVFGNAADRGSEDDHPHRSADEAVRDDDQRDRRRGQQVERSVEAKRLHEDLVEQSGFGWTDRPQPEQDVEDRRAHPRQQPDTPEEAAGHIPDRRRGERQDQAEGHVEDRQRAEDIDEGQADDLGSAGDRR